MRADVAGEETVTSLDEYPALIRDDVAHAVIEDAELVGFWVAWHKAGGFGGLEAGGWHRATIYRKVRRFRARFGVHPDEYRFDWIKLDLRRACDGRPRRRPARHREPGTPTSEIPQCPDRHLSAHTMDLHVARSVCDERTSPIA